jgi:NADPH:quinone reductase-like Zn-dependent oxidoreductase
MEKTIAWILKEKKEVNLTTNLNKYELDIADIEIPALKDDEVLVECMYGCWEGNMQHELSASPIDIYKIRNERKMVLGNAGVVRVLKTGKYANEFLEGDICIVFCGSVINKFDFPTKIFAYDESESIGLLSKRTKINKLQLIKLEGNSYDISQWAGFSLRYITAWSNWKAANKVFESLIDSSPKHVLVWGGGVSIAQAQLANLFNIPATIISSSKNRCKSLDLKKINFISRLEFLELFEQNSVDEYLKLQKKRKLVDIIYKLSNGLGASIIFDHIGGRAFELSKALLSKNGIISTCGWKDSLHTYYKRPIPCLNRQSYVHTFYANYNEGLEAIKFATKFSWLPEKADYIYSWDEIPKLSKLYAENKLNTYFPVFSMA